MVLVSILILSPSFIWKGTLMEARRKLNVHDGADYLHSSSSAHSFFLFIIEIARRARSSDASIENLS